MRTLTVKRLTRWNFFAGGGFLSEGGFGQRGIFAGGFFFAGGGFWSEGGFVRRGVLSCSRSRVRPIIRILTHVNNILKKY